MNSSNENSCVIKNFINASDARKIADSTLHDVFLVQIYSLSDR